MSKVVHFDASKLTPFVHENELKEMQAMVTWYWYWWFIPWCPSFN